MISRVGVSHLNWLSRLSPKLDPMGFLITLGLTGQGQSLAQKKAQKSLTCLVEEGVLVNTLRESPSFIKAQESHGACGGTSRSMCVPSQPRSCWAGSASLWHLVHGRLPRLGSLECRHPSTQAFSIALI